MSAILHDEGDQIVYHIPRDERGIPWYLASATYRIVDTRYGEDNSSYEVATGTAAPGGFSTTTDAAAGPSQADPRKIPVAATTDAAIGRTVILQDALGLKEIVEIARIGSGDAVYATHDLRNNYASGSTVKDVELQVTFPAAEAADDTVLGGDYLIIFTYTIAGQKYLVCERQELGRFSSTPPILDKDVEGFWPGIGRTMGDRRLSMAIAAAWTEFQAKMSAAGVHMPQFVVRSQHVRMTLIYGALSWGLRWKVGETYTEQANEFRDLFYQDLNQYKSGTTPVGDVEVDLGEQARKVPRRIASPIKPW